MRALLAVVGVATLFRPTVSRSDEAASVSRNLFVPVVLEAPGRNGAWYSTELTLTNAGSTPARVVLTYRAIDALGASGSGTVEEPLPAGRQRVIPALIPWLRERGIPIPEAGPQGGTLRVRFEGLSSAAVGSAYARTTTPSGAGRAGVGYRAGDVSQPYPVYYVIGLQETEADRSNLGLANADETAPVTLRVKLYRGRDGTATVLPDVTLSPGGWAQLDSVLKRIGAEQGYARVERVAGSGPFVAYGVVNDNVTGDGAFIQGRRAIYDAGEDPPFIDWSALPVATESALTRTEVSYVNYAGLPGATLSYQESLARSPGDPAVVKRTLVVGEQLLLPNVFDELRGSGGLGSAAVRAGRLLCLPYCPSLCAPGSTLAVGRVLTDAEEGRGRYGVSVPVIEAVAHTSAWVHGLRHDSTARSNLGITNPDFGRFGPVALRIDVFDGETGSPAGTLDLPPLPAGGWTQVNSILGRFGVRQGYVRITSSVSTAFYAYGVINDGASPGEGTGDASFVPMTIEE